MVSSRNDVISTMRNNVYGSYSAHFNSSSNKRGVSILQYIIIKILFQLKKPEQIRWRTTYYTGSKLEVYGP
jgi:hypothetical protein